ncbi:cytochrome P450 [Actinosynnema sp. NPDC047251]|uniref:Cytochrome P450-like protein n=1 Tax=Saccharothrix espanaensis (strain ATCC 51144 / DSM 44229 / JCM 9112 / NBRC 15066 / NRRL 15764) TaxID=1179773 RepID=K0K704_SACES|nr:cytochrome P450 [Saccharothrix espanaensis]CCH32383.1 Cytochrome P450-like protein [Saccharothrix espanaensis DSM 44229]
MRIGDRRRLRRDPLEYVEELRRRSATGAIPLPGGGWCLGDPEAAHALLRGREFNTGRSGFFGDLLPTRAAQVEVGHAVRDVLRARLPDYRAELASAVAGLPSVSRWPETGNRLVYRCLADLLLHPGTPAEARSRADRAAHVGVVFRSSRVWRRARAEVARARVVAALTEQVRHRRQQRVDAPRDVLDAVLEACPDDLADRSVAQVHLTMFRAVAAPVAASLAWSVLLACLHHTPGSAWPWPADQIVREAMRHRPIPWMLRRAVPGPVTLAGTALHAGELVSVSPHLLHHDPRRWTDPDAFRPDRWALPGGHGTYLPFGAGPFACPGASVAQTMVTEALTALAGGARLSVTGGDPRAVMSEGIVPRPFTLHRTRAERAPGHREEVSGHGRDAATRL